MNPITRISCNSFHLPSIHNLIPAPSIIFRSNLFSDISLKKWSWFILTPPAWLQKRFDRKQIQEITKKLDGTPRNEKNILTVSETIKTLSFIRQWVQAKNIEDLSPDVKKFIEHLLSQEYLKEKDKINFNGENIVSLHNLSSCLDYYIGFLTNLPSKKNHAENWLNPDSVTYLFPLDAAISSAILYPKMNNQLLSFSKKEINYLGSFASATDKDADKSEAFEYLAKAITDPAVTSKYDEMCKYKDNVPFFVDGKIVTWSTIGTDVIPATYNFYAYSMFFEKLSKMQELQKSEGGLEAIRKKIEQNNLDIVTTYRFMSFARSLRGLSYNLKEENFKTQEARNLFFILKNCHANGTDAVNFPVLNDEDLNRLKLLETHVDRMRALRQLIEAPDRSSKVKFINLLEFLTIYEAIAHLNVLLNDPKFSTNPLVDELRLWAKIVPGLVSKPEDQLDYIRFLKTSISHYAEKDINKIFDKVRHLVQAARTNQTDQLTDNQKLSPREYYACSPILDVLTYFTVTGIPELKSLMDEFDQIVHKKNGPYVHVCFFHETMSNENAGNVVEEDCCGKCTNKIAACAQKILFGLLWPLFKIISLCGKIKCIRSTFQCYGHVNFLSYDGKDITKHGLDHTFIYHKKISGHFRERVQECEIDANRLIPKNLPEAERDRFKRLFFENLNAVISFDYKKNLSFPRLRHFFGRLFLPSIQFRKISPIDVSVTKNGRRNIFCSQFVCEAVIEAQVKTCKDMNVPPPESLSFFGLYHRQRLDNVVPCRFRRAFINKGIFKPIKNPFLNF